MQTFLPYESFHESAAALDLRRLGKQIIECRQIGRAITDPTYGWQSHPAVGMWRGHLGQLLTYASACNNEWFARRGRGHGAYRNMCIDHDALLRHWRRGDRPAWLGWSALHASHRSNLLRKDPEHYGRFGWTEPDDLPYEWPTNDEVLTSARGLLH